MITSLLFLLQPRTTEALLVLETFPVVSHSFCKMSSLTEGPNSGGKKIAVCLAFLMEGYSTQKVQDVVYILLISKAALPARVGVCGGGGGSVPKNNIIVVLMLGLHNTRYQLLTIPVTPTL